MTEYEKKVAKGLPPMNSMEWLLLEEQIENDLKFPEKMYKFGIETMLILFDEVEYFLKNQPEKLETYRILLEKKQNDFKNIQKD